MAGTGAGASVAQTGRLVPGPGSTRRRRHSSAAAAATTTIPPASHGHHRTPAGSARSAGRAAATGDGDWATRACTWAVAVLWYGAGALTVTRQSPGESSGPLL